MKRILLSFFAVIALTLAFTTFISQPVHAEPSIHTCADGKQHPGHDGDAEAACRDFGGPTQVPTGCPGGQPNPAGDANVNCPKGGAVVDGKYDKNGTVSAKCGDVATSINYGCDPKAAGGPIYGFLRAIIKFAGGLVGLLVIMMLIIGGIRYITSAGNPKLVAAAKTQIVNAIIGLVLFALMLAILNFLLPGGIIG